MNEVTGTLLDILSVLIAAKVAAEIAERLGMPVVVAEIAAGLLVGPSALHLVGESEGLRVLGELGVILLLLEVGLQMDLGELARAGRVSLLVATLGIAVPFASGWGVATMFGEGPTTAIFVGAALTATSVGITARVFSDLRALSTKEARTVLGAAVADDVLGLVILTVVVRIAIEGSISILDVGGIMAIAVGFLVAAILVGIRLAPPLFQLIHRSARSAGTLVAVALAFTLGFAMLAGVAGLAPIVGAFVAGLALARSSQAERIRRELTPVGHLFIPVFFLQIGIDADVTQFADPEVLGLAGVLLVAAIAGKLLSGLGSLGQPGDKLLIGLGMMPRGEVGLIFAGIGLREGILGGNLYAAVLLVVLASTLLAPPLLRARLHALKGARRRASAATPVPAGGWLRVRDGIVDLAGTPPEHLDPLHIGLDAALLAAEARPGPKLLDWYGSLQDLPVRWDKEATQTFFRVLREGNMRSWRFLEVSALLERALPELAQTLHRRRADPFELDPGHALRWSLVEAVRDVLGGTDVAAEEGRKLEHPEWLLLAALIIEAAGDGETPVAEARRLAARLDLGATAEQEIALLVGNGDLMRAAVARPDGLTEEPVLQMASFLEKPERARALYLLSVALDELELWERRRLDELHDLIQVALAHPELTGRSARNVVERRRAEAIRMAEGRPAVAERIRYAPTPYLLTQASADVVRQASLLEPLPPKGTVRVAVTAAESPGEWRIELGCRDQSGLLARMTGVLAQERLDVIDAVVATWGDGGAIESFRVRGAGTPDPARLESEFTAALAGPLGSPPTPGAELTFDDAGSPWYTLCDVVAPDRPGLLHTLAVAFTTAGADVHSARVATVGDQAIDRFELTDRNGAKLDDAIEAAIRERVESGVEARRSRWKWRKSHAPAPAAHLPPS